MAFVIGRCLVCRGPIHDRPYQKRTARACSLACAAALFRRENPTFAVRKNGAEVLPT